MILTVKEKIQVYGAVCFLIDTTNGSFLGGDRPAVNIPSLISARDKLRRDLEACGYLRAATLPGT